MEKRPIVYGYEQARTFDYLNGIVYALEGDSRIAFDVMGATGTTVVSGGAATADSPADMSISVAPISIYQIADVDATAYGALPANTAQILQIGHNDSATALTFSTSALTSGQSQWALVEASLLVSDSIPSNDPNSGLLLYYNATNPSQPYQGQNNSGVTQNTLRSNTVALNIVYGAVAATGSEVPPSPSAGAVPLYLIDLTYGQTQIVNIITAGPSAATNVPSNYPHAPFLAGLLNSHHSGGTGQAPQINLATETQGNFNRIVQGVTPPVNDNSLNLATTEWVEGQGDLRYGPIKINTISVNTTLDATYQGSLNNITAISTATLPALSSLTSGQTYVFDFESQVINAPVACNAADTMTVNGITGATSFPMNPGSYLRVVGIGGTAGAWVCKYVPAAEPFLNTSGSDIVLHAGEKCYYQPSSVANLLLHIASNTNQRYRFLISSTAAEQAVAVSLAVNNTSYSGSYRYTQNLTKSDATFAGTWWASTAAITFATTMLSAGLCDATVCTDTTAKTAISIESQSDGTIGYMGITTTNSSDTTTVWSSLGTILNCPIGLVTVERIQ